MYYLKSFLEKHGELGRDEINELCSEHKITMGMDAEGKVSYWYASLRPFLPYISYD